MINHLPICFNCSDEKDTWLGTITTMISHGSHYEIHVQSRSALVFLIGHYAYGGFISIPAFNAGCDLAGYGDYFWNCERLTRTIGSVDAITVAQAIRVLSKSGLIC